MSRRDFSGLAFLGLPKTREEQEAEFRAEERRYLKASITNARAWKLERDRARLMREPQFKYDGRVYLIGTLP